ncbi:protein kinase domain-containing protein [Streptomyces microflavus]|uniref:protein kinase domain-containing protein n=1 Tax=Streptomyces microflavus TaxID=1919 RepID=UPI00382C1438
MTAPRTALDAAFARHVLVPPTGILADLRTSGMDVAEVIAFTGSNTLVAGTADGHEVVHKVAWGYRDVIDGLPAELRPAAYGFTFYQRDGAAFRTTGEEVFRREAELTTVLSGAPGVPSLVLPVRRTAGGRLHFAITRCAHGSVAGAVAGGWRLPPQGIGPWLVQALTALGRLHALGHVHGDLGPDNTLLDGDGLPVIADFGSARPLVAAGHYRPPVPPAWVRGELHWPPEYATDRSDPRPTVDLYSLGVTTFFAATGRYPRYGAELAEHVPSPWSHVLTLLVAPDPRDRPATVDSARSLCEWAAAHGG